MKLFVKSERDVPLGSIEMLINKIYRSLTMQECPNCGLIIKEAKCLNKETGEFICPKCDSRTNRIFVKLERCPIVLSDLIERAD